MDISSTAGAVTRRGRHAVVVGASMGGLAAAAAVAPFYDRVTVLDRDALPAQPAHRRGVPQGKHAHGLQPGGLRALEELLPGLTAWLLQHGGRSGDISADSGWSVGGNVFARRATGIRAMGVTRPFLEHAVRSRVSALPNVVVRDRTEALRPVPGQGPAVVGIEVAPTGGGEVERLVADLVVDASGRASRLPQWLGDLGLQPPEEERVHCRMAYLTRRWRLSGDALGGDVVQVVTPATTPQFGVCIAQEDGSHIVTLGALLDGAPARSDEAYLAFARSLPSPRIAEVLEGAQAVTDYQPSHFPFSRRRRFDRLATHPTGLVALGDSIASFNPMYGQGMSVAALEAVALRDMLRRGPVDPVAYYKQAHRLEDVAWTISTSGDLRFGEVEGRRTAAMRIMNAYLDRLTLAARQDPVLAHTFLRVAGFIDPPQALLKPAVVWRSLRGARKARVRAEMPTPTADADRAAQHVPASVAS
jgi:2-polyprenyl-6-methoxyphenol hydroxylase-like FAD-dependent oxidoreductase